MHVSKFCAVLLTLICSVTLCAASAIGDQKDRSFEARNPVRIIRLAERAMDVALSPDGKLVAVWDDEKRVVSLHNANSGQVKFAWNILSERGNHFQFSPDSQLFAVVDEYGTIRLWDVDTGMERQTFNANHVTIRQMAFSPDGETLACTSGRNQKVLLWDVASGLKLQSLPEEMTFSLAFSPDGKFLAASDTAEQITIWDWKHAKQICSLDDMDRAQTDMAYSLAFLGDNKTLISCHGYFRPYGRRFYGLRIWDVTTGELKAELTTEKSAMRITLSSDERIAAVATYIKQKKKAAKIVLFDLKRKQRIVSFPAQADDIIALQFSRSGKQLISAGRDGTLKYWGLSEVLKQIGVDEGNSRGDDVSK